ncbi:MAG: hypothetical protein KDK12_05420 [Rhodobacteraceae bacterium]|nr:hypothetical protein [Paracoccaceae bacterium]
MPRFTHAIDLPLSPARALPLFTPRGEEAWVPGWDPRYIDPADGATAEGMIFSTGDDSTWWTCLRWVPPAEARYLRLTPGVKAARVGILCSSLPSGSRIAVSYDWHALNAEGEAEIAAITPEGFAAEIEQWRVLVLAAQG